MNLRETIYNILTKYRDGLSTPKIVKLTQADRHTVFTTLQRLTKNNAIECRAFANSVIWVVKPIEMAPATARFRPCTVPSPFVLETEFCKASGISIIASLRMIRDGMPMAKIRIHKDGSPSNVTTVDAVKIWMQQNPSKLRGNAAAWLNRNP